MFLSLKNLLALIHTKLHSKSCHYPYLSFLLFSLSFHYHFITVTITNNIIWLIFFSTCTSVVAVTVSFVPKQPPLPSVWLLSRSPWGSACNSYQSLDRDKVISRGEDKTNHVTLRIISVKGIKKVFEKNLEITCWIQLTDSLIRTVHWLAA